DALPIFVTEAQVPAALYRAQDGTLVAATRHGLLRLPEQSSELVGADHPFADQVRDDLVALCAHPDVGDLVLSGWCAGADPVTFAVENGAHGGFAPRETNGIALLDSARELPPRAWPHVRPADLRVAALRAMEAEARSVSAAVATRLTAREPLLCMTYNVHGCRGMDGKISTGRIARVIEASGADIIALQELDAGRARSRHLDQAHAIARALAMHYQFFPVVIEREEHYGIAVLSRLPVELVRAVGLPARGSREPRGALWVEAAWGDTRLQIINTHLSLNAGERRLQVDALDGDVLEPASARGPLVLLGDLNATPRAYAYRALGRRLCDVERLGGPDRVRATWFARQPIMRLDHIFVSPTLRVVDVDVLHTADTRLASDHLPLLAEIALPPRANDGEAG
ncbi:MAG: endonuclease/exonuclease/phosphatase family protein, partial [Gammaproteobacteria bacterium]